MDSIDRTYDRGDRLPPPQRTLLWSPGVLQLDLNPWQQHYVEHLIDDLRRMNESLRTTWEQFAEEAKKAGLAMSAATAARRKDTLRREAAAALGRGDRKTHRKALAELRQIEQRYRL